MELGLSELSPKYYTNKTMWYGKEYTQPRAWSLNIVCKNFVCANYDGSIPADRFMKERISFIEIAFRQREEDVETINSELPIKIVKAQQQNELKWPGITRPPDDMVDRIRTSNYLLNNQFRDSIKELNERFKQAGKPLNYHNGFIQLSADSLTEVQIETPFWQIVREDIWKNVDIDMKEAIDRRDGNDRDPVFYAAKALESAIKIISDRKGWTHGGEKGAHNYIDNLASKRNGKFIEQWEQKALKDFFSEVRNPFGHGPGSDEMPELTTQQTNWAIETCMSWIKSLVKRM